MVLFAKIAGLVLQVLTGLPGLIQGVESLWAHVPKSGAQKWIAVEQAVSGTIQEIANEVVKNVPSANADEVAGKVALFTKASNDAFVKLMNDLNMMPGALPAATPPPAA